MSEHTMSGFAAGRWRAWYGHLSNAGIATALRGWVAWRAEQIALHPAYTAGIDGIYAAATAWLRQEAQRRLAPQPTPGRHLTTAQLLARHGDRLCPTGDRWRGVCPWHNDTRPSLVVYADGHTHCFACGAHRPVADLAATWDEQVAA